MSNQLRHLLVPGGGGSGPEHWHHRWAEELPRCDWVLQADSTGGTRGSWVTTLDEAINAESSPVVLIAHSLATIVVAHWAQLHSGPVVAAFLVAPADVEDDWAEPASLYKRFAPIPLVTLPFPTVVVASTNDPLLSNPRAEQLADAWGAQLEMIGDHLHVGSDADLGRWPDGRRLLADLVAPSL